ncbi:MAG TPA: hypothetical protein ENI76_05885 [Ignavibacteria bacterium]|nr:hypothetical protein [Ignavibacteria bacterium]
MIDLVMDSHSKIAGVGELSHYCKHLPTDEPCSCGERLKNCSFWQKVFKNIDCSKLKIFYRSGVNFLLNKKKYLYYAGKEKEFNADEYVRLIEKVYKNILFYSGKEVVFDSSKDPDRAEAIIRFGKDLDIVLLHLVRNGKGVSYSNIRLGRSSFRFMKKWLFLNLKIEIIKLRNRKVKNIFVSYEDFTKNQKEVLCYILSSFDLLFEPEMLNIRNYTHHQPGGNFKLRITEKSSIIKTDEVWKTKMSIKDKVVFNTLFGWLNLFYKIKVKINYGK